MDRTSSFNAWVVTYLLYNFSIDFTLMYHVRSGIRYNYYLIEVEIGINTITKHNWKKKLWSAIKNKNKGERKTTPTTCFLIVLWTVYPLKCWSLELEYHHVRATYWVCVIGRVLIVFSVSHSPAMSYFYYSVCIYNLVNRLRARNRNRPLTSALHVGIFMNSDL